MVQQPDGGQRLHPNLEISKTPFPSFQNHPPRMVFSLPTKRYSMDIWMTQSNKAMAQKKLTIEN